MEEIVLLSHGGGGEETQAFLSEVILSYLNNPFLQRLEDATPLSLRHRDVAITTDSFTIKPLFFPGGDIGKLAICGTINDLLVMGAKPQYLTLSLVIEEGFSMADLRKILESIKKESLANEVYIVAGDTKVMPRGALDGLIINTTGIGEIIYPGLSCQNLQEGDVILVTGSLGEHGVAILAQREDFSLVVDLVSDCASLKEPLLALFSANLEIHALRDPTRGGLAAVLHEWARSSSVEILVRETDLPIREPVKSFCGILGLEVFHLPSEGRAVMVMPEKEVPKALEILHNFPLTAEAKIIGKVLKKSSQPKVYLETPLGTLRLMENYVGEMLPRIC